MNKILLVTLLCVAAASAATKTKTSGASKRGFGIGTHDAHPEVVHVGGHGSHGGGGEGWGAEKHGKLFLNSNHTQYFTLHNFF